MKSRARWGWVVWLVLNVACRPDYVPKPKGYNRIDLPPHAYEPLRQEHPYFFEHSTHAEVLRDTFGIVEPHWVDISYPAFNATVQITYKSIADNPTARLVELNEDARRLASRHQIKAYAIEEAELRTRSGHVARVFELSGEVPSQFQFFTTDSTRHFMRGALYFPVADRNDSLRPVIDYIKTDMVHLLNTLEWRE